MYHLNWCHDHCHNVQHNMTEYGNNSFRSYLDREPDKFTVPGPAEAVKEIKAISMLKPKATRIEFHIYPNEHVVVLEGENLWFCHKIRLGEFDNILDVKTPAQNVTQRMIQFNFPPYEKLKNLVSEGVVKITLHSHFANPIRQNIQVMQVSRAIIIIMCIIATQPSPFQR